MRNWRGTPVGENRSSLAFERVTLEPMKVSGLVVTTQELSKAMGPAAGPVPVPG